MLKCGHLYCKSNSRNDNAKCLHLQRVRETRLYTFSNQLVF